MAEYVDGYVVPVPTDRLADYRRLARIAAQVWIDHGALSVRECVADDVKPGRRTSFPRAVKLKPEETVVLSWITFPSRRARDRINAKAMADPRLASMDPASLPLDGRRMFWGGFKTIVAR